MIKWFRNGARDDLKMLFVDFTKIVGVLGAVIGIEIVAILIFMVSAIYLRNQQVAGLIGNLSSMSMAFVLLVTLLKKDK